MLNPDSVSRTNPGTAEGLLGIWGTVNRVQRPTLYTFVDTDTSTKSRKLKPANPNRYDEQNETPQISAFAGTCPRGGTT